MSSTRCEIDLAITYAYWAYPAIGETLEESCAGAAERRARLAQACTSGSGRRHSVHDYWLCPEHAKLIPILDAVVRKSGDEPRLMGLAGFGETEPERARV
jgi:hypothetical protein